MIDSFKSSCVLVVVDNSNKDKAYKGTIPASLRSAAGSMSPRVVISSSDASKVIMGFDGTKNAKEIKSLSREMKKKIKEDPSLLTGDGASASDSDSDSDSTDSDLDDDYVGTIAKRQEWTNSAGKAIQAAVVSVGETNVVFLMDNKKQIVYPLEKLSGESQDRLALLRD